MAFQHPGNNIVNAREKLTTERRYDERRFRVIKDALSRKFTILRSYAEQILEI